MSKMELVGKAIRFIRYDLELVKKYADRNDLEMYGHMIGVINAKVDLLFEIDLINTKQYRLLYGIVSRMEAGSYVRS